MVIGLRVHERNHIGHRRR